MPKVVLTDIGNDSLVNSGAVVDANNDTIEGAFDNTLSRDGTTPNAMDAQLDMNSNRIINLASPVNENDAARLKDVTGQVTIPTILSGEVDPTTEGREGDYYINTITGSFFGPKGASSWPASVYTLKGPQGNPGAGTGDMLGTNNLSEISSVSSAQANLQLRPGVEVAAYKLLLSNIGNLSLADDQIIRGTGTNTVEVISLTDAGAALIDDADAAAQRTTLGLGTAAEANIGTSSGNVASATDSRFNTFTIDAKTANYTLVLTDAGKLIRHASGTAHSLTIPPNSSVAYPIGTAIAVRNQVGGGDVTITRGVGVTLYIAGQNQSNDVTLSDAGYATLVKEDTNTWFISGVGLS